MIKTHDLEHYDAAENILYLLKQLGIKSAEPCLRDLRQDMRADFYCDECESTLDECVGHTYSYRDDDYYDEHAEHELKSK